MTASGAESYTKSYTYNDANQLLKEIKTASGTTSTTTYTYDNNGNQLTKNTGSTATSVTNTYNAFNQLTASTVGGTSTSYTYTPDGLRLTKGNLTYLYDRGNLVLEMQNSSVKSSYVYGVGLVSGAISGYSGQTYFIQNGHGDIVQLQNSSRAVVKEYTYDAFGNEENPVATDANPFRYAGEYYDANTGTYYLRARYYDPVVGRFTQEDPIEDGANWYVYCYNSPTIYVDFWGLAPTTKEAAAMAQHAYGEHIWESTPEGIASRTIEGWRLIDHWPGSEGMDMLFYIPDGDDWQNPTEYAIVFVGTEPTSLIDWKNNLEAYVGSGSADMVDAINYSTGFVNSHSQETTFVGHSKGGGEAIAAATATGKNAITFNAANFEFGSYGLTDTNKSNIQNYYIEGEILHSMIGTAKFGTTMPKVPTQYWTTNATIDSDFFGNRLHKEVKIPALIKNHSMSAFLRWLEQ